MSDLKFQLSKLNDSNYSSWEFKVKVLLEKDGLSDLIADVPNETTSDEWKRRDAKARSIILFSIEDAQLQHCRSAKNAYNTWLALKNHHEKSTLFSKVILLKKICRTVYSENESMVDHLSKLTEMFEKLSIMGENINDNLIVAFILSSLPESYDTVVMSLETREEKDLTSKMVKDRLLDEYERRKNKEGSSNNLEKAFKINRSIQKKFCNYCKRSGHLRNECFFLKNSKNNESNKNTQNNNLKDNKTSTVKRATEDDKKEVLFSTARGCKDDWFIDSAATSHICSNELFFEKIDFSINETVFLANGDKVCSSGIGFGYLDCVNKEGLVTKIKVTDVLFIPKIEGNLLSVKKLTEKGIFVNFKENFCEIGVNDKVIALGKLDGILFKLNLGERAMAVKTDKIDIKLLHNRLGHRNIEAIRLMIKDNMINGVEIKNNRTEEKCEVCIQAKIHRKTFPKKNEITSKQPLELIHTDLCGPMSNITPSGSRYFLTFIDDYSRFCVVYILKNKGEVFEKIKEYLEMVENQLNGKVKIIRSDNGGEYISYKVRDLLKSKGIIHQFTVPYCPEQNGVAERKNRSLQEMANCMIIQSKLEKCFWAEAILTSNHLQNRMSTKLIKNKTPYELWFGKKPNLNYLRTFGCRAYAHLPKIKRHKMDTKAKAYRFIGYSEVAKGYRLLDEKDKTVIVSRDVEFIESEYGDDKTDVKQIECVDQDALIVTFESDYEDVDVIDVNNQDEDNETIDSSDNTKNSYSIENIDPKVSGSDQRIRLRKNFSSKHVLLSFSSTLSPRSYFENACCNRY